MKFGVAECACMYCDYSCQTTYKKETKVMIKNKKINLFDFLHKVYH